MKIAEYQERSKETALYGPIGGLDFIYPVMGLAGEAGEILNKVKKIFRDDAGILTEEVRQSLKKELGDCAWYLSQCCTEMGFSLEDVLRDNLSRLADRKNRGAIKGSGDNR